MTNARTRVLVLLVAVIGSTLGAGAAPPPKDLVRASLIADVKAAAPGQTFHIGLLLRMKADWHVYWEYPGESGSPTRLRITAPAGVSVGAVEYPVPKIFKQPGDVVGYGYENEVMLIAPVTLPKDWPVDKAVEIKADASWLCCKDVCLPGKAKLELTIPMAKEAEADNRSEFTVWSAKLPISDAGQMPFKTEGTAESLKLTWNVAVKEVKVLTVAPDGAEVAGTEVKHEGNTTAINNKVRFLERDKARGAPLGMLVIYEDVSGQQRGAQFGIPLRP
jgi:DsbC/DsbD-like thiol-disulfide interchange protein